MLLEEFKNEELITDFILVGVGARFTNSSQGELRLRFYVYKTNQ